MSQMVKSGGILRQAGPLMLGRGGATALGFALPLILTRLLPQAEFGTYKQVWLVVTTAWPVCTTCSMTVREPRN